MVALAAGLRARGAAVSVLTYYPQDFFAEDLRAAGIDVECVKVRARLGRVAAFWRLLRRRRHDAVLAFLPVPSLLAEVAALPAKRWGLVVSERLAQEGRSRWTRLPNAVLHRVADFVTTNSHTNRLLLERTAPWLRGRVATIYNGVDLEKFSPSPGGGGECGTIRLLGLGRFAPQKNVVGLVDALRRMPQSGRDVDVTLDWYGESFADYGDPQGGREYWRALSLVEHFGLGDRVRFHAPTRDVVGLLRRSSGLVLPSFFEGLPNAVAEAMSCGVPVLASDVGDARCLVEEGVNGLLFDPRDSGDIARTVERFAWMTPHARRAMGMAGRAAAERLFRPDAMVSAYARLLEAAAAGERVEVEHTVAADNVRLSRSAGHPSRVSSGDGPAHRAEVRGDTRLVAIAKGVATYAPAALRPRGATHGSDSARYCYGVWLRHLVRAHVSGLTTAPSVVAELGPGDTLGSGFMALLCGACELRALDVVSYADVERDQAMLQQLIALLRSRAAIPDEMEFPRVRPRLASYDFPRHVLDDERVEAALAPDRLEELRCAVRGGTGTSITIRRLPSWGKSGAVAAEPVDLVFSQAVMEHVEDVAGTYASVFGWLRPGGFLSQEVDYSSHGKAVAWNGHWGYADWEWRLIVGRRPYLLNRLPHSAHLDLLRRAGFRVVLDERVHDGDGLLPCDVSPRFRGISDQDLHTRSAFFQAVKPVRLGGTV